MLSPRWPGLRALLLDLAIALLLTMFFVASSHWWASPSPGSSAGPPWQYPQGHPVDHLSYSLLAIAGLALVLRRVWPLVALGVTVLAIATLFALGYPWGPVMFAGSLQIGTLACYVPVRRSLIALGATALLWLVAGLPHLAQPLPLTVAVDLLGLLLGLAGLLGVPWAVGVLVRNRRWSQAQSREELDRRRAYEQRLEVARDVHDVVGHGLAVINMQAGVALHVLERRPDQAQVALQAIRQASKDALDELRATLALYRQSEPDAPPRRPPPGLEQVGALAATMGDSGLQVEVSTTGERGVVPSSLDLAGYRIVQESLTNVLRHADGARARVLVHYRDGAIEIEVTDDGGGHRLSPAHEPGHGIAGMRERAAAVGGELEAGPRPEGGFLVHAWLPRGVQA
jgi:signal transduction histidine kinase